MKKLIAFLLAAVLLLSGCQSTSPKSAAPGFTNLEATPGQTHSDHPGLQIRVESLKRESGKTKLVVIWQNDTQYDATYGVAYAIERLEDDTWVSCAMREDLAFIEIACILPGGKTQNETYDLTDAFDVSKPGTYRIKTECYLQNDPEKSTRCQLMAEFTMEAPRDESEDAVTELNFQCQYIRSDDYQSDAKYPQIQVIPNAQKLKEYCANLSLSDACARYDEAFFAESFLVFVLLEEGSGSIRHQVEAVEQAPDKTLHISILRVVPEVGTCDMAQWHVILELSRDALVETANDVSVYLDGKLACTGDVIVPPQPQPPRKTSPDGILSTPIGEVTMARGGCNWTFTDTDGTGVCVIGDQAGRPLTADILEPIYLNPDQAETVYLPVPGSGVYEPTNHLGYPVKLYWEVTPTQVTCTCWPDTAGRDDSASGEVLPFDLEGPFYAKTGGYIYEFTATWEDTGMGFHGTASYYAYITDTPVKN